MSNNKNFMNTVSRKKLYKAKKNWLVATAITAGVLGGAMVTTNTANADANTPQQNTTTTAVANSSAYMTVNGHRVTAVASASPTTSSASQPHYKVVASATPTINSAAVQSAQNQLNSDSAQLTSANTTLNNYNAQSASAQTQLTSDSASLASAQSIQANAQSAVNSASAQVATASQANSSAQNDLSQAQSNYSQAVNSTASQEASSANQTISTLRDKATNGQTTQLDNQISDTQSQINTAQNKVNNDQSQITNLQNQVKSLQNNSNPADSNIESFSYTLPNGQTVTMRLDKTKSLLENASRNNLWNNYYNQNQSADSWNGGMVDQNMWSTRDISSNYDWNNDDQWKTWPYSFPNIPRDVSQASSALSTIDTVGNNTMTEAQQAELAILVMNEINHVRAQYGLAPFTMTEKKFQQGQVRASQSSFLNFEHNSSDAISAFGSNQNEALDRAADANEGDMYGMFASAEEELDDLLNNDASSNWLHRQILLLNGNYNASVAFRNVNGRLYMVFDASPKDANDTTPNMMDRINQYAAEGPTTGTTTDNSAQINSLNSQISSLQSQLATDQSNLTNLQNHLQDLQTQRNNVAFDINNLDSDDQQAYHNAEDQLNTINDWKQSQLNNMANDPTVQQAQAKVNQTQAQLNSAEDQLDNAQQQLDSAKLKVQSAQAQVALDNDHINGLNNLIAQTKSQISQLTAKVASDKQALADAENGKTPAKPDNGKTNPSTPTDNKGNKTNPSTPTKPNNGKTTPSTPADNKGNKTTPTTPVTPNNGHQNGTTPTTPAKPNNGKTSPVTPNNNSSKPTTTTTVTTQTDATKANNKPTIVLPSDGNVEGEKGVSGHYVNAVNTNQTREQYKAQQANSAKLPQTGNENTEAVTVLGIVAGMLGLGLGVKSKKRFN